MSTTNENERGHHDEHDEDDELSADELDKVAGGVALQGPEARSDKGLVMGPEDAGDKGFRPLAPEKSA